MTSVSATSISTVSFPRTGKRGVPQQFPRRLYEMLESEFKLSEASSSHQSAISWSESGNAFRICDVSRFSSEILSKYFRTSKFSSFQRNLNLYGFTKVRRGPEADMYAHPSFVRGHPHRLSELRKCNSPAARKSMLASHRFIGFKSKAPDRSSTVSPSPPSSPVRFAPTYDTQFSPFSSAWALTKSNVPVASRRTILATPKRFSDEPDTSKLELLAKTLLKLANE